MKDLFHGYYLPSKEDFEKLWKECLFGFDASFLLNLYHYPEPARTGYLNVLTSLGDRLWLPHQAALEYQRGRLKAICQEFGIYGDMTKDLQRIDEALRSTTKHPFAKAVTITAFQSISKTLVEELDKERKAHEDLLSTATDPILLKLTQLFDGRTGSPYPADKLAKLVKDGADRYDRNIPPGFADRKDKERDGRDPYGDLIIWMQLLDKAKETQKGIIFVTDDMKEDWWLKYKDRVIAPHPLLRHEMQDVAGVPFYLYNGQTFVTYADEYLQQHVEAEVKRDMLQAAAERQQDELDDLLRVRRQQYIQVFDGNVGVSTTTTTPPPLAYSNFDIQRCNEWQDIVFTIDAWGVRAVSGHIPEDQAFIELNGIRDRIAVFKIKWRLPDRQVSQLDTMVKICDTLPAFPPEMRRNMITRLTDTAHQLFAFMIGE